MHCKAQNKQVNQPYINFFFLQKLFLTKKSGHELVGLGWVHLQKKKRVRSHVNPFLLRVKKNQVQVGYFPLSLGRVGENLNLFFHV